MKRIDINRRYVVFTDNKGNDIMPVNDENSVFIGEGTLKDRLDEIDTTISNTQMSNKSVLAKISEDSSGQPLYNGSLLKGQKGDTGNDGVSLEIRKTDTEIQYRYIKNNTVTLSYSNSKITTNIEPDEKISRIVLAEVPDDVPNAQVKTVTVFGTNDDGTVGLNINPSILTMPQGAKFECFGGLDPSLGVIDISKNKELVANAKIEEIIDYALNDMKKYDSRITKVTKIFFHIYFLDKANSDVKRIEARYIVNNDKPTTFSIDDGWETLITLSEITPNSHIHNNKVILDALSDDNGVLKYNGKEIGVTLEKFNELEAKVLALETKIVN